MRKLKELAEVAILLPIAHIIVCVIFLAGYITTFGGNVSSLFSVSDSFTITLGDILVIYTFTITLPFLTKWYENAKIGSDTSSNQVTSVGIEASGPVMRWLFYHPHWIALLALGALTPLMIYVRYFRELPIQYIILIQLLALSVAFPFHGRLHAIGVSKFNREVLWLIVTGSLTAFATGLWRGDYDRHQPYTILAQNHYSCGPFIVIRAASNRFIAAGRSQNRYVIDDKCKVVFQFPSSFVFQYAR